MDEGAFPQCQATYWGCSLLLCFHSQNSSMDSSCLLDGCQFVLRHLKLCSTWSWAVCPKAFASQLTKTDSDYCFYHIQAQGTGQVDSRESDSSATFQTLVTQELTGVSRSHFLLWNLRASLDPQGRCSAPAGFKLLTNHLDLKNPKCSQQEGRWRLGEALCFCMLPCTWMDLPVSCSPSKSYLSLPNLGLQTLPFLNVSWWLPLSFEDKPPPSSAISLFV